MVKISPAQVLEWIREGIDQDRDVAVPPPPVLARLQQQLPDEFVAFIAEQGFCSFRASWLQLCDPAPFAATVAATLRGQDDLPAGSFVLYCYDALGTFCLWSQALSTHLYVDPLSAAFVVTRLADRQRKFPGADSIGLVTDVLLSKPNCAVTDRYGRNLFSVACSALGRLQSGEVYGWSLPLAADHVAHPDQLRRTPAPAYLAALANGQTFARIDDSIFTLFDVAGFPEDRTPVPDEQLQSYAGLVPAELIDVWRVFGFCSVYHGELWLADPSQFRFLVDDLFGKDPHFGPMHLQMVSYNAFGDAMFWSPTDHVTVDVGFTDGEVITYTADSYMDSDSDASGNRIVVANAPRKSDELILGARLTINDNPAYGEAAQRLGRPDPGELYAYVPALALGGERRVENLRRVRAREHLAFLASAGRFTWSEFRGFDPAWPTGYKPMRDLIRS